MSILTTWGYRIKDADNLADLISLDEFNTLTANRYVGDVRIPGNIKSASQAIRNYVGWHLAPTYRCVYITTFENPSVVRTGSDYLIQLPAMLVRRVTAVLLDARIPTINDSQGRAILDAEAGALLSEVDDEHFWSGEEYEYTVESNGLLHVYDAPTFNRFRKIRVVYDAGVPDGLLDNVKELVAHRVTHALASSNGVTSESAGGMSVTYNSNWINSARSSALPDDNKEVLQPYKLQGVF